MIRSLGELLKSLGTLAARDPLVLVWPPRLRHAAEMEMWEARISAVSGLSVDQVRAVLELWAPESLLSSLEYYEAVHRRVCEGSSLDTAARVVARGLQVPPDMI